MKQDSVNSYIDVALLNALVGPLILIIFTIFAPVLFIYIRQLFSADNTEKKKINKNNIMRIIEEKDGIIKYSLTMKNLRRVKFLTKLELIINDMPKVKLDNKTYKVEYIEYHFHTEKKYYEMIKDKIQQPLSSLKEDALLISFYPSIHYSLSQLSSFIKLKEAMNIEKIINQTAELVEAIKKTTDEIDIQAKIKTEEFKIDALDSLLTKHDITMQQEIKKAKIYSTKS